MCCGVWLVPIYTNIMSCFVEDLNNQHSGSCLELLYGPSGVVVMSQLMMEVHLTEAAGGFLLLALHVVVCLAVWTSCWKQEALIFIFFLVRSHAVTMSASVLFHLLPWNGRFSWSALCVGTASSRAASIVLLELGAPKQQCRDWVMVVWALLGSAAKLLVMSACATDVLLSHRREASIAGSVERDVLSHI